jgi:hypothetical protein
MHSSFTQTPLQDLIHHSSMTMFVIGQLWRENQRFFYCHSELIREDSLVFQSEVLQLVRQIILFLNHVRD